MFQTLKAQNGSHQDSEYVVQSSIPASDKLKAAKKPPACTRCKMRKVRPLPIEPHLPNAGPDSYLIIASRLSTVNHDSALTRFQLKCVILAPDNCIDDEDACSAGTTAQNEDPCSIFMNSLTPRPSSMDLSAITPVMTPDLITGLPQDLHTNHFVSMLDSSTTLQGDDLHDFDFCFCVDSITDANAMVQTKLVWSNSLQGCSASSIDDMLQCQKNVLASCETFFNCKKCSNKWNYVALVISMCRELVIGVKTLESITTRGPQTFLRKRPRSDVDSSGSSRLEAGGWRLDDDDEMEIIKHLPLPVAAGTA
ncbi:hypothetical protein G7054_g570 [Neopestalotiopsis clavispora]|nr:hypothetical protein G7054_g570 [Neopestalotiopsis clavispora]